MKTRRRPADRVMAWLAATILCVLAVYAPAQGSGAADRQVLETLSNNQPTGPVPSFSSNLGTSSSLFVPVILTASGQNNSFFTSELTLTNRGDSEARLEYTYTAHRGGGSGKATEVLAPGQQKIKADALAYLRRLGIPIPDSGNRIGTLRVEVAGASEVGVSVRTTTSVPEGRAGLAYPGIATADGFQEAAYLCGLRQNSQDRSNVAFQNMGTSGQGNVTLKTTVYSGDAENRSSHVLPDVMLPPGGFHQYNGILNRAGFDNGYVKVERVEGTASFYAYGVINDQANSDGSFVFPVTASSLTGTTGQTLPVIVETGPFTSELTVTNFSEVAKTVTFRFRAEAVETADKTASFEWTLQPGQQVIVPDIVERMRQMGTAGIGPSGQTFAGALFAAVASSDMSGIVIGARTSSSDGRGGQYGVSYNAVPAGGAFTRSVWVDGLQQNQENRSNLALVNTGEMDGGDSSFTLEIYDGATGRLANTVTGLKVAARGWRQINGILGKYAPGTTQGYVRISKMSGNNPFLAYGVVNDGGALGQRSGDGAYLPAMAERIQDPGTEPMTDREVLEVFHYATGGPEWNNRTNWLSDLPLSEWFGVEIDGDGRVTSLILEGNRLIGAIPPVLSQLTRLKDLNLGEGNLLSGAIPPELGQLSRLQTLNLWDSQLSGGIPPELGGLTQLQSLSLSDNPLSGTIPPELGGLTQLQSLGLGGNQLSGAIPPVLGQLSRLKWLSLTDNQLSGTIPPELGGLTQLQLVKLGTNRLSGTIPPELGQLTRLKWLFLTDNQLSGAIPPELGRLSRLHLLDLGGNPLSGAIPKNLQQLSELTTLNLQGTQVCVPTDAAFQAWLGMIAKFLPSGLVCDGTRRVLFLASSYEVREGESVTVSVRLIDQTGDPLRSTAITLTAKPGGGAAAADYSGVPESITIMPPLNEASFDFTAVEDDHFDHSETVVLGFRRPLPSGVTAGDPDTATVRIIDPGTEPMTDREVLAVFHYATGGPEWNNRTNWLSDLPLSEWFGVEIDGDGRVTSLILEGNRLIGAIPPVLSQLTRLKDLNLGEGNLLSGAIPPELGQLSRLQTLNLWDSQLSGGIPPELGGLTQLQSLSLSDNPLSGTIPPELGGLTQLQSLGLGGNQLSGAIPPVLGQLSRLKWLFLTDNQLSGAIPPELGGLTQLQSLGLGGNQLSGAIPPELGGLTQLQLVKLGTNRLSGTIPPELGQLTRLKWLFLTDNQLSGAIPPELGRLSRLHLLDLGGNPLSGAIPKNLQQLSELTTLNLQGTQVCVPTDAAFQAWLGMIAKFLPSGLVCDGTRRVLFLASSYEVREGESVTVSVRLIDQTGDPLRSTAITLTAKPGGGAAAADYSGVPESITIMPPLNEASFDFTAVEDDHFDHSETVVLGFRRPLPSGVTAGDPDTATVRIIDPGTEEVSDREALEALYHATGGANWINRTNWLSAAPLSEWFGVVTDGNGRVTNLRLPRNGLSGSISPALGRLTPLQELYLPDNQLTGAIPPELGNLSSLVALNLGGNQLTGAIPPELGQLSQLQTLNLRNNQLSGTIPPELAGLTQLQVVELGTNRLSGTIPPELGGLTQLQSLSLGGNQLSGAIPPELGGLTQLRGLNLGQNQLSGTIPPELGGLTQLQSLSLGGNQLSGAIPPELGGLTQLRGLNLGQNQLSGTIPPELGGLTQLQSLSLGGNQLSGAIPPELGGLTQLRGLNLGQNQLSGTIPPELGGLTQLQSLSLGGNQLSGAIPPELGGLTQLQSLSLGGNQLSGGIPPELGGLTQLHWLDLSFNQDLTGPIPAGLQQLPLSNLDLMATSVCIPEDAESQEWLAMIEFTSSGLTCGHPAAAMSEIDIAVFYTPAARKIAGGTAAMEAMIDLMIAETNPIYVEDGVNQRLVLVAREEVEYSGSGSGFVDLRRLADASDGYMDGVHVIREQVGADLIHLISYVTDVMGVADLAGPFGLTCASCGPTVFTHELGHNMGVLHDRYSDGGYGLFPYSHGYLNQRAFAPGAPKSARWQTIMAYGTQCTDAGFNCDWPGRRRFSNPNQTYLGDPIGVPGEERTRAVDGPADAVRTLNIMRHSLASFRPRASGNQLRMSSSFSQARPVVRTGDAGPAALVPGGNLFQVIAANGRAAASPQAGGALARATLRRREVSIDIGRLATVSDGGSMALRLNLFDDVVLTGMIDRRTPTYSGGYALSGQLAGVAGGSVTLVVNGSVVAGTVRIPGATYRIRPAGSGRHAILQVDPSQLPHECGTVSRKPGRER